ncbi:hypothetical protein Syun_021639 [Stephania yunnanensis]|uniref:Uncharacterized protein n=1 Tax=Stephania yunnanensis TaxID=152371 RepID=A0AAP0IHX3_9MAGN
MGRWWMCSVRKMWRGFGVSGWGCRRWGRWGFHGGRGDGDEVRLGLLESELDEIMNKVAEMSGKCAKEVKVVISPYGICPLGAHVDHQKITDFGISAGLENSVAMNITDNSVFIADGNQITYDYLAVALRHNAYVPKTMTERLKQYEEGIS